MIQPPDRQDQEAFARRLVALLEALRIPYAIGGSLAAMEYSVPRLTIDIDLMVMADATLLADLVEAVESWQLYITPLEVMLETNVPHQVPFNIIDGAAGTKADVYVVAESGLSGSAMVRRQRRVWDVQTGAEAWFLAPEDAILYKLVYYRKGGEVAQKHPLDIAKILVTMGRELDVGYIEQWARELGVLDLWSPLWDEFIQP